MGNEKGAKGGGERDAFCYHWKALKVLSYICVCVGTHAYIHLTHINNTDVQTPAWL